MKKATFLLMVFCILIITGCKKMPKLKVFELEITSENVAYSQTSAEIKVEYDYPTNLQYVNVTISESNYFGYSIVAQSQVSDTNFIANFVDLHTDKKYYYRFEYSNGINVVSSDVRSFYLDAASVTLPTVVTKQVTEITGTSAVCGGEITDDGGYYVTSRGVCWSKHKNPTIFDSYTTDGMNTGSYTSTMTDLEEETVYYVRAFAINEKGTSYGTEYSFQTVTGGGGVVIVVPTVTTTEVSNITAISASCGGNVIVSGGAQVTERGICWSTNENPTISNMHVSEGTGTGEFTCVMSDLNDNTTYHVRAYATNSAGTAYGEEKTFTTLTIPTNNLPIVTTANVLDITTTTAVCGGDVTDDSGFSVVVKGVCWNTTGNPTINDSRTNDGFGTEPFTSNLTNLVRNTTYHVRAYASNNKGTGYGEEITFTTAGLNVPEGAVDGLFSISPTQQIFISKGNLQYQASSNTWRFAEDQWVIIGEDNSNISSSYSGWIDLFGWATSGYNHGSTHYQPWSYEQGDYNAYGSATANMYDETGQADWGYNAISNGGNAEHQWRSLLPNELNYILNDREVPSGLRNVRALVNGVKGIIIFPDDWNTDYYTIYTSSPINGFDATYADNTITDTDWRTYFDAHGAVFLPNAGYRQETSVYLITFYENEVGMYWLDTKALHQGVGSTLPGGYPYYFEINDIEYSTIDSFYLGINYPAALGYSVRLVRDAE